MQFYRDGYRPGDPDVLPASPLAAANSGSLPAEVDVLIVGTGPAGTVLGAQLAAFPGLRTRIVERRVGPLEVGRADGVACRTVEMFQAFGLADALLREAYWVNEVRFWGPSDTDRSRIVRTGWVEDTPDGLSEFPHVIVNQARLQQYLLDHMARAASRLTPDYGVEFVGLEVGAGDYPVTVTLRGTDDAEFTVRAKYVVGCDGARSAVRRAIGRELHGDSASHAWGVMDVLATTDFPDWRTKNVIQSAGKGTLLMIPREGGNLVRCYVDLGEVTADDASRVRGTRVERLIEVANGILHPYSMDVRSVAWSSVYEVGQRITDKFDDVPAGADARRPPHVFIAGDACHTHSAKAGQGMNVSMQDAFNLGWKLAAVLEGRSDPALLPTYSAERHAVAQDLIDFDKFWSAFIAQPTVDPAHPELGGVTTAQMRAEFARQGRYTAGLATTYRPSVLTGDGRHQALARGFEIGTRFHSAPVVRVADARPMQLGHAQRADGRWRVFAFGDDGATELLALMEWLAGPESPAARFAPADADVDSVIDVHGVFRCGHHEVDATSLPEILLPRSGRLGLQDWEKAWAVDPRRDIFAERGIGSRGAMVIVRPDQYVANVLPLTARAELTAFFAGFLIDQPTGPERSGRSRPSPASAALPFLPADLAWNRNTRRGARPSMSVEFLGIAATNDGSEITARTGPIFDKEYTLRLARAHEENGWDRVLFAYGSNAPDPNIGAAYIASKTEKLQLLLAHRPNVSYPTFAAKTFATVDQVSDGRTTVHFITGGTDHEQQREGDYLTKDERYERTRECMQIVKQAWTSREPFGYTGKHYKFADFVSDVFPVQQPRPRLSFGGSSPAAYAAGGAEADIYCLWGEPLARTAEQIESVRRAAKEAGRTDTPRIQVAFRPIIAPTEAQAWEKAHDTVARIEARVQAAGGALSRRRPVRDPENTGSQRLIAIAAEGERFDRALWTPTAAATGGAGNSNALVGTPETVAQAILDYIDIGVDIISMRGYDLLQDAIDVGQQVIPLVREEAAKRTAA